MDAEISDVIETYKDLACNPFPGTAILRTSSDKDIVNIFSSWTTPDLIRAEPTKFTREFLLQCKSKKFTLLSQGIPCDTTSVVQCAFTKSGSRCAVLRKMKKNDSDLFFLEIWNLSQKERTFDMTDRKEHGKIHDSGNFQSFEWSANDKYLLYIAEMKQKKSESYFKDIFCQKSEAKADQKANEEVTKGEENAYQETWGESHTYAHHSVLCIFDVETGKVEAVNMDDKLPNMSAAQGTWGPNDECIVFVGYKETPFRLGVVYCKNRNSSIYSYNLETKKIDCLTSEKDICAEYPVFSPNFETFVYLENKVGGPHASCRKLMKYDWKKKEISTVIDIVENANGEEFAGIYVTKISSRGWSMDSQHFFFHSFRRSFLEIFCVDVFSTKIRKLNTDKLFGSYVLHDVKDPYILVSVSSPNIMPHLMIGHFSNTEEEIQVTWSLVDEKSCNNLKDLNWSVHTLTPSLPDKTYPNLDYDIVVISSNEKKNGTLVIFPHGGPHSVFFADFYLYSAAFARLGYTICKVNYRGSIGFGENSIKSLLGNIGTQDVSDVINAIEYLKKDEKYGIQRVIGFGGSHGGFLIGHLLGQYPDLLKAAVIRNPVIDLTSMVGISDIPDWCWIESGCSKIYDPSETVNPSSLKEMWERSPIKYMKKVKSPTMLCLGKNDLRVPSSQGLQFHKYLKVQNVPTKVFFYDDNHALSKVGVSSDAFVHIALWFLEHSSS